MQKIVYLSNSRDYTEQGNINENKYFKQVNELLEQGWKVALLAPNMVALNDCKNFEHKESIAAFVLLEKGEEDK